ncbi:MAG TPA: HU family DNA-binding protein, partial [Armatimonadetes bacterium]|nr:HU family DNA-binding protein [Armatimonadota bacterium]
MNKTQLVEQVAKKTGLSKAAARQAVDAVFGSISEALAKRKREPVTIAG